MSGQVIQHFSLFVKQSIFLWVLSAVSELEVHSTLIVKPQTLLSLRFK
jgi:hypothetical protein